MADPWGFVDAVYCITLDTAVTRHAAVEKTLRDVGLWHKTTMLYNRRHPRSGIEGCFESHRAAWERARRQGVSNVLIVEDDVFFSKDWRTYLPYAAKFTRNHPTWDILFLGWTPFKSHTTEWPHIAKISCGTATHAYILSRRAIERGVPSYDQVQRQFDLHIMCPQCPDRQWEHPFTSCSHTPPEGAFENYVLKPMIAFQRYDNTSATGTDKWANKRKQRIGLMRFFGNHSTSIAMPTLVLWIGIGVLSIIAVLIILCVQACKRRS